MIRGRLTCILRRPILDHISSQLPLPRPISGSAPLWAKKMPDRPQPVDETEFTEAFLKGSGPGGQKIVGNCDLHSRPANQSQRAEELTYAYRTKPPPLFSLSTSPLGSSSKCKPLDLAHRIAKLQGRCWPSVWKC